MQNINDKYLKIMPKIWKNLVTVVQVMFARILTLQITSLDLLVYHIYYALTFWIIFPSSL